MSQYYIMYLKQKISKILAEFNIFFRMTIPRPSTKLAREKFGNRPVKIIEIGTYEGRNAKSLLKCLNVSSISFIDPYELYDEKQLQVIQLEKAKERARKAIYKLRGKTEVNWVRKKSQDASKLFENKSADFIYIDGDHRYSAVKKDIELYWPKLKDGGILAGHDIDWEGVVKAIGEFSLKNNLKLHLKFPDWMIIKESK